MAWYLNDQLLDARGVEDLTVSLRTQATSQMHFNVVADFDAAAAFAFDTPMVLRRDSTIVFQGTCDPVVRAASPESEGHAYHVSDAWQKLEDTIYQERWAQSGVSGGVLLPMVILGMSAAGAWESIGVTIETVIEFAAEAGVDIAVGEIAAGDVLWPTAAENVSCAEVIRKSLKFYPSYVTWIDYSVSPPTFNVTAAADMETVTLDIAENDTIERLHHRRCPELLPEGVRFAFKTAQIINGVVLRDVVVDKWPAASANSGPRILTNTIELQGMMEQFKKTQIQTRPMPVSGETSLADAKAYLKRKFPHLAIIPDAAFAVKKWVKTIVPEPDEDHAPEINGNLLRKPGTDLEEHLPNELVRGHISPGMLKHVGKVHVEFKIQFTDAGSPTAEQKAAMAKPLPPGFTVVATNAVTKVSTTIEQFELGDTAPIGLAKVIYEAIHDAYPCEGSVGLVDTDPSLTRFLGNKISVTDLADEIGAMTAIVHSVDLEIQNGRTTIGYGPSPHLMVADFLEMQRLIRTRPITTFSFDERTSERLGSESKPGSKGDSVQAYDVPETVFDPIPLPTDQFQATVIASGAAWKASVTPGWVRFSNPASGGDTVGYWLPATLDDDPAPTWTVSTTLALYALVATDKKGLPTAVTIVTAAKNVASTHYQPDLPDGGGGGVNGAYYYKIAEFEMDGGVLKPKQYQTGGPIVHCAELWQGKNVGDGDYKVFKRRNNSTDEYEFRRIQQLYAIGNSALLKPVSDPAADQIEVVSMKGRRGQILTTSDNGEELILDVDAESLGTEDGIEIYKTPELADPGDPPPDTPLQFRKIRGISTGVEGRTPQVIVLIVGDDVVVRGNGMDGSLTLTGEDDEELARIVWEDGLMTTDGNLVVPLGESLLPPGELGDMLYHDGTTWVALGPPAMSVPLLSHTGVMPEWIEADPEGGGEGSVLGAGGENHPWKVIETEDGLLSCLGGIVYGQGAPIEVPPTAFPMAQGVIYLEIARDEASRELTTAELKFSPFTPFPDSDQYYQIRAIANILVGGDTDPFIHQLQFEEMRILELMILENGEFMLAPFELSSRNTYAPPP